MLRLIQTELIITAKKSTDHTTLEGLLTCYKGCLPGKQFNSPPSQKLHFDRFAYKKSIFSRKIRLFQINEAFSETRKACSISEQHLVCWLRGDYRKRRVY